MIKAGVSTLHMPEKAKRREAAQRQAISAATRERASAFERDGYAVISDVVDRSLLEKIAAASEAKLLRADEQIGRQTLSHKSFWIRLLDEDMRDGAFGTDNVFVQFAMQPRVIELLCAVFGEMPILVDVLLTLSREAGENLSYSQLWHRDHDDPRTVKMFVYLTDVKDIADGPFTFIPKPESDKFGFSIKSHLPDDRVFNRIDRSAVREMVAPRLTVFMVETSRCLHMGSRMKPGHSRLLYTATYVTVPRIYPVKGERIRVTSPISPDQQLLVQAG